MGKLPAFAGDAGYAIVLASMVLWLAQTVAGLLALGAVPVAALYLHAWLTILNGGWTALRRLTWLLLTLSWFGAIATGFLGYGLPLGQLKYWLASLVFSLPTVGQTVAEWIFDHADGAVLSGAAGLLTTAPFAADVAVSTVLRLRGRPARRTAAFLAAAAVLVVLLWLGTSPQPIPAAADGPSTPADIVPGWYMLPWYAILRGPADKLLGAALMVVAALLPMAAPWLRTERFRSGASRVVWPMLCVALLADFIGLGWLGAQPPDGSVIVASQVLTVGWFAFFLLAPPLLNRIVHGDGQMS